MSGIKKLAAAGLTVLGIRLALLCGAGAAIGDWMKEAAADGRLVSASLTLELGRSPDMNAETAGTAAPAETDTASPAVSAAAEPPPDAALPEDADIVETTISGGLAINNGTDLAIDAAALTNEGLSLTLPVDGPQILIVHTHASEAYTPDGQDKYTPSDPNRTEDTRYNVVRVGDEIAAALESYGLSVLHDREIYDYPSYTGCYSRSGAAVEEYLKEYPGIAVVIDVHRDALGDGDVVYKTKAAVAGECSAQVMLLAGTGESGLPHPNWKENLKLALYLQQAMNAKYPTLARPVDVVPERYNQQLSTGSLLLEVGSSGNTLQEALCAARLFANAAGPALLKLVAAG
jgi:stage II sporulation protein P